MASVVFVAVGGVLIVAVSHLALQQILENRLRGNMKKHLGRRGCSSKQKIDMYYRLKGVSNAAYEKSV